MEDLKLTKKQKKISKQVDKMTNKEVDLLWRNLKLMHNILAETAGIATRFSRVLNTRGSISKRAKLEIVLLAMADEDED